jgi:hypothetical protein
MEITYTLSNIPGFNEVLKQREENKYITAIEYTTKSNEKYTIVRYNKDMMTSDLIPIYGLLRSVIVNSQGKVVCFSPPKSVSAEKFISDYPKNQNIVAQEFVEGTMINVFFDASIGVSGCWQIATRNTVGGDMSFYQNPNPSENKTFHQMFNEACTESHFDISSLNPSFCYSFVLQHPCNRIVIPFSRPQLYLVDCYRIEHNDSCVKVHVETMNPIKGILYPKSYNFISYKALIEEFASPNTSYNIMGVVIRNLETGERTKIRNPIYEEVRQLRGNQPKLQYQYLCLRKEGQVKEFLNFYPEKKHELSKYRDLVHIFTETLHKNYVSCYVKKEKPLKEYPEQYRTHMFKIHEIYLRDLRAKKHFVNNSVVIQYVNNMHPSLLMYSLNYHMRKRFQHQHPERI